MNKAIIYWSAAVCYMIIIYYLSSLKGFNLPKLPRDFDKVVHMCIYIPLSFLFYHSLNCSGFSRQAFVLAILGGALYGVTDEIHQLHVIGRDASIGDAAADLIGSFLGSFGARYFDT